MTTMLGKLHGCFALTWEGTFFEHRPRLDRLTEPADRAAWIATHLARGDQAREEQVVRALRHWLDGGGAPDALALYREAMRELTESSGRTYWVQKATSYVFHARTILQDMPDARLIYMLRNPYDFAASRKRRTERRLAQRASGSGPRPTIEQGLFGTVTSWNRGVQILDACQRDFPGRLFLVRYETLVTEPAALMHDVCNFLQVPFDPAVLDVPHINPSENEHTVIPESQGLDQSRLYYYTGVLTQREQRAIDLLVDRAAIARYYPELPHRINARGVAALSALPLVVGSAVRDLWSRVRRARRIGVPVWDYFRPRLRGR
jgi:hypothetical protein